MNKTASVVRSLLLATDDALYSVLARCQASGKEGVCGSTEGPPPAGRWKPPEDSGQVRALWHVPRACLAGHRAFTQKLGADLFT